jgi:hypothetical protein
VARLQVFMPAWSQHNPKENMEAMRTNHTNTRMHAPKASVAGHSLLQCVRVIRWLAQQNPQTPCVEVVWYCREKRHALTQKQLN